jgi:hypothetical protein
MEVKMPKEKDGPFETRHDPGPWRWSRTYGIGDGTYWCLENDESAAQGKTIDPSIILRLCSDNWLGEPFLNNPNARLIALAPTMYEALEALDKYIDFTVPCKDGDFDISDASGLNAAFELAAAAIAKVKGEL